jgi:hypothetical protein
MSKRSSSTWWADPNGCLSGGILKRLQWRSPCDTAGGQTIFRVLPGGSIFPSLRNVVVRASVPADPLALAVCDDDDVVIVVSPDHRRVGRRALLTLSTGFHFAPETSLAHRSEIPTDAADQLQRIPRVTVGLSGVNELDPSRHQLGDQNEADRRE